MPETITTDNKTLVKDLYTAMADGDMEPVLSQLGPDVRWTEPHGWVAEGTFTGPAAVAGRVFENVLSTIDDFSVATDGFVDDGDRVVALGRFTGKVGGTPLNVRFAHVWTVRNGMVTDFENIAVTGPVARLFS